MLKLFDDAVCPFSQSMTNRYLFLLLYSFTEKKQANLDSYYVNEAYDADDDMDGSGTYKSAVSMMNTIFSVALAHW